MKTSNRPKNPFSSMAVRPGAIPYLANRGLIDSVIKDWRRAGEVAQIVGPHGAGKTTLAIAIAAKTKVNFDCVKKVTVRTIRRFGTVPTCHTVVQGAFEDSIGSDPAVRKWRQIPKTGRELWIVDGLERLNWLNRYLLVKFCRYQDNALIITSHRKFVGLPVVSRPAPTQIDFKKIVKYLLENQADGEPAKSLDDATIARAFTTANGNVRDALMSLYDEYEQLRVRHLASAYG